MVLTKKEQQKLKALIADWNECNEYASNPPDDSLVTFTEEMSKRIKEGK